ncbi:fasciclin domain-containing protein [Paraurantiacibacter namhicola]|uniref:Fasciclin domain protein n=1 Tax=Paraurantiacibacter namhicola TaxID=645517 RepID=A0A1C7DAR3_9SPHN|nr:fasciclin domain-containing protein [Paraurantiacibacter namhicola]ANU08576.1 Fasciclin domain protein [Paraurantiacibacter namhicola]
MIARLRIAGVASLGALALALGACSDSPDAADTEGSVSNETLAKLISHSGEVGMLASALEESGIASAFDAAASYTVLAPSDEAFEALASGEVPLDAAQKAAIVRGHIVPGYLTLADIGAALDSSGGEVSIAAMDGNDLTFTRLDDGIEVSSTDGQAAMLGSESLGENGVVITIDGVLKAPPGA